MNLWSELNSCHLWASLHFCKYLQATFVFFWASSVVQINLVNNGFIWSVTYPSYCIVLITHFEKKKLIQIHFWIWHER